MSSVPHDSFSIWASKLCQQSKLQRRLGKGEHRVLTHTERSKLVQRSMAAVEVVVASRTCTSYVSFLLDYKVSFLFLVMADGDEVSAQAYD